MADVIDSTFPTWGLLPKRETQVTQFLSKYPTYDGRNIVIAVFDSGVDPGAPGLQKTSDGKTKIIARFDCSGAGDVDTSKVVEADESNCIYGLSGRKLTIPKSWNNPSNKYHIGLKNIFELYPKKLKERVVKYRKERLWDPAYKTAEAEAVRNLKKFEGEVSNPSTVDEKLTKEDLEAKVEIINSIEKKFADVGPALDCIVFHDNTCWKACIDTSECGDLEKCVLLSEYSFQQEYATLNEFDSLNYTINVHNDGSTLEIASACSSHGTHVASIAAAYFPDDPDKNGVAPGAQIVSLGVGDSRLQSMETGTALVRAMIQVMNLHCPIINMSYGEFAHFSSSGRIGELMNEVIDCYNVVWVASAGNHGPALATVGTPPDISTESVIGVGAYVSPEMMAVEYSLREKLPGTTYTWSSCGPTVDGGRGVSVCAPGGAITSVPNFTLCNSQLMNGTSMSAPHVSGTVALLLSAMKSEGINTSPYIVKRALENTAKHLPSADLFVQGCGLVQVEEAYKYLCNYHGEIERDIRFQIHCGGNNNKGIHLRNGLQDKPHECTVSVQPFFLDINRVSPQEKIAFNMNVTLSCSESWVYFPSHLNLTNVQRSFSVKVDPSHLTPGAYYTCILAYDVACVSKGPVFRIPITVVKPTILQNMQALQKDVMFKPGTLLRNFFLVPRDATWCALTLKSKEHYSGRFMIHALQLKPKKMCKSLECVQMATVNSSETTKVFPVEGGLILEVVIAKYWANLGEIPVDFSFQFRGIKPDLTNITMQGSDGIFSLCLKSNLQTEEVSPVISLKNSAQVLRPTDSKVIALLKRDVIPATRQIYELQLTYGFNISAKSTEITIDSPLLSDYLYESEFESQLWMLFNSNKQYLASGDAYSDGYQVKVEKGDYVVKMHVRHEKKDLLDRLQDKPLILYQKLSTAINLDVYSDYTQAITGGKKTAGFSIPVGQCTRIYVAPLNNDKYAKGATLGQFLSGTVTYTKDELVKKAVTYPFKYVLHEMSKKPTKNGEKDGEKTKWKLYQEALREVQINWLSKLEGCTDSFTLYEELKSSDLDNLPVHMAMLHNLHPLEVKHQVTRISKQPSAIDNSDTILTIVDSIVSSVDQIQLLAELGTKNDFKSDSTAKNGLEKRKSAVVEAIVQRGILLCQQYLIKEQQSKLGTQQEKDTINALWVDMLKFADATDTKSIYFSLWHAIVNCHYGRVLKYLLKLHEEKPCRESEVVIIEALKWLGLDFCANFYEKSLYVKYPIDFRCF